MDDGTSNHDKRNARLHTDSFSKSEVELLIELIKDFGPHGKVWRHYDKFDIGFSGKNYDLLMDLLKDYITLNCFKRKVK